MRAPGSRASSVKSRPATYSMTRNRSRRPLRKTILALAPAARGRSSQRALQLGVPERPGGRVHIGPLPDRRRRRGFEEFDVSQRLMRRAPVRRARVWPRPSGRARLGEEVSTELPSQKRHEAERRPDQEEVLQRCPEAVGVRAQGARFGEAIDLLASPFDHRVEQGAGPDGALDQSPAEVGADLGLSAMTRAVCCARVRRRSVTLTPAHPHRRRRKRGGRLVGRGHQSLLAAVVMDHERRRDPGLPRDLP